MAPEQEGTEPQPEREESPYHRAARFRDEGAAGRAYFRAQAAIFKAECELSSFRLQVNGVWHVAVLGERPAAALDTQVEGVLDAGEATVLPPILLEYLEGRRERLKRDGLWVERHYRRGEGR